MQVHPADVVTYRDIGRHPVPHVDEPWIAMVTFGKLCTWSQAQ